MSSNIRIEKTCQYCGVKFIAKTTVTKFCSDNCAKRAYKARNRDEKIQGAIYKEELEKVFNPEIKERDFLSIRETCQLIGMSRWTIYRLISSGKLIAHKIGNRTIITRIDINNLFK